VCDLLVGLPCGQELEDLGLAGGERFDRGLVVFLRGWFRLVLLVVGQAPEE
jgi:hypothetical protein